MISFWLVEKVARSFLSNQRAKSGKTKSHTTLLSTLIRKLHALLKWSKAVKRSVCQVTVNSKGLMVWEFVWKSSGGQTLVSPGTDCWDWPHHTRNTCHQFYTASAHTCFPFWCSTSDIGRYNYRKCLYRCAGKAKGLFDIHSHLQRKRLS